MSKTKVPAQIPETPPDSPYAQKKPIMDLLDKMNTKQDLLGMSDIYTDIAEAAIQGSMTCLILHMKSLGE